MFFAIKSLIRYLDENTTWQCHCCCPNQ